jgi:hypothetical protein
MPGTKLQEHAGSDKAWVWSAVDFSEGEQRVELFCIRFGSTESERRHAPGAGLGAGGTMRTAGGIACSGGSAAERLQHVGAASPALGRSEPGSPLFPPFPAPPGRGPGVQGQAAPIRPPTPRPHPTPLHPPPPAEAQEFKAKYEECEAANAKALAGAAPATATKGDAAADAEADKLADEVAAKAGVKESPAKAKAAAEEEEA